MKKIAYIIPNFPVLSETFVGTEIRAMQKRGHTIIPISLGSGKNDYQPHDELLAAQTIYLQRLNYMDALKAIPYFNFSFVKAIQFAIKQQGMSAKSLLFMAAKIAHIVAKHECTHIHAHFAQASTAIAIVTARLLDITVSFVGHGHDVNVAPSDLPLKLAASDIAIAVSDEMKDKFLELYPSANIHRVNCGIEPDRFKMLSHRPKKKKKLVFIGRLIEPKGVEDLLSALVLVPPERRPFLDIIGDGELRLSLESMVSDLNIKEHVTFWGKQTSEWIVANADQYLGLVAPFKPAMDGSRDAGPVVVKEAMAMGLPVITTNFSGCKEMVSEETGYKVEVGDITGLAECIDHLCKLPFKQWQQLSKNSRARVTRLFTSDSQAKVLSNLIESL